MLLRFPTEGKVYYHSPDADEFERHWENAHDNPDDSYYVLSDLRSVYGWMEVEEYFDTEAHQEIWSLIEECDIYSPGLLAAGAIVQFEELSGQEAYLNALAGVRLLDEAYTSARSNGWYYVSPFYLEELIDIQRALSIEIDLEIERGVELLNDLAEMDDIPLGTFAEVIDLLLSNSPAVENNRQCGLRALGICIRVENRLHNARHFFQERSLLAETIELADILDVPTSDLKERYVNTYRLNAERQGERDDFLKATELMSGLNDEVVLGVLADAEKKEWKEDMRSAAESAARNLRHEGVSLDSVRERWIHQEQVERYIQRFKQIADVYDRQTALFWLLSNEVFVPDPDQVAEEAPLTEQIQTLAVSLSGHMIEFDPQEAEISARYVIDTNHRISLLISVFSSLFKDGTLFEGDLYQFLNSLDKLDSDNLLYLTIFISAVFEDRHTEAIHVGAPRMEAILYSLLRDKGEDVDALMEEGTGTRTLGSLIPSAEGHMNDDLRIYLRYMYNEPEGQLLHGNIRNRVTHGLLFPAENNRFLSLLILVDLLRVCTQFHLSELRANYGVPSVVETNVPYADLVIESGRDFSSPSEDEILSYIGTNGKTIEEVSEEYNIPYDLTFAKVKVLEELGDVEIEDGGDDRVVEEN